MRRLSVESMGDAVQGVRLRGDKRNPEPEHFRVCLPFGDVDIAKTTSDTYWVHVRVNRPSDGDNPDRAFGVLLDARVDVLGKHATDTVSEAEPFRDPDTYHVAVLLGPADRKPEEQARRWDLRNPEAPLTSSSEEG